MSLFRLLNEIIESRTSRMEDSRVCMTPEEMEAFKKGLGSFKQLRLPPLVSTRA